jgi:hypothetical protein
MAPDHAQKNNASEADASNHRGSGALVLRDPGCLAGGALPTGMLG